MQTFDCKKTHEFTSRAWQTWKELTYLHAPTCSDSWKSSAISVIPGLLCLFFLYHSKVDKSNTICTSYWFRVMTQALGLDKNIVLMIVGMQVPNCCGTNIGYMHIFMLLHRKPACQIKTPFVFHLLRRKMLIMSSMSCYQISYETDS